MRGGGHDWAGRALRDGGLVIDLGEMRDGVVTTMRIRLHPDRGLVGGHIRFSGKEAATVLARYAELTASVPDGLTVLLEMASVPEVGPCLLVVPVWSGDPEHPDAAIGDVMRLGTAITSAIAEHVFTATPLPDRHLLA